MSSGVRRMKNEMRSTLGSLLEVGAQEALVPRRTARDLQHADLVADHSITKARVLLLTIASPSSTGTAIS